MLAFFLAMMPLLGIIAPIMLSPLILLPLISAFLIVGFMGMAIFNKARLDYEGSIPCDSFFEAEYFLAGLSEIFIGPIAIFFRSKELQEEYAFRDSFETYTAPYDIHQSEDDEYEPSVAGSSLCGPSTPRFK